jgi:biotin operon repressor
MNKLTKDQVLAIPKLSQTMTVSDIARSYNVSWQAVWYWAKQLKDRGHDVRIRNRGRQSLLDG